MNEHHHFMDLAIKEAKSGMHSDAGGPFGAVIVRDGTVIATGHNQVTSTCDPTAHAEVVAIRKACKALDSFQLEDCIIYTSCEPCPMCLGAIYWARPKAVYFACTKKDAAQIQFDDDFIYDELGMPHHNRTIPFIAIMRDEGLTVFKEWEKKVDKKEY